MNIKTENMGSLEGIEASESTCGHSRVGRVVAATLALWLGLVLVLGARGAFVGNAGAPPMGIFLGFATPLAAFFAAYFGWSDFRAFVHGIDLRLAAGMQAWRFAGLGFISLYAHGVLPALFAFPAGLGDMAVAIAAPWIVLGLVRNPSFATSRRYVVWNIMGIIDFLVAMTLGTLSSGFIPGLTGNVTTSAMAQLPLVLVPAYLVPLFIMLHFTALTQARRLARSGAPVSTQMS